MKRVILALAALFAFATGGYAASNTGSLYVYANVIPTCMLSAPYIYFADYMGNQINNAGTLYVACNSSGVAWEVTMDAGLHYNGAWRNVSNGTQVMQYEIAKSGGGEWGDSDHADTYLWGSGVSGTSSGSWDAVSYNAILFGNQIVPTGSYSDIITLTVYF